MNKSFLMAGIAGLALAANSAAQAQSIDYGSLQQLFNEPVTTSATGSPQRSTEAPADMQIISADEIRRSGETTIPGILQRAAGIDVLNESAGSSDVNIRGYDGADSPRLLVLVNGRQVYEDHFGLTDWAAIPVQLSEIRQIEVVKGPSAALFGFNAVSGVVNIITYNPKYDSTNVATAQVGINGERQTSLVTTFKIGPAISVRLSGGATGEDEWKVRGALPLATSLHNPSSAQSNLDAVAQLAPKTELRIEGSWSNVQQDGLVAGSYGVSKTATTSEKATLTSDTQYGLVQAQAYQNQGRFDYQSAGGIKWNNTITVASVQDLFKIGSDNTVRIAGEYRYNTLNVAPIGDAKIDYNVESASAMWNWAITKQLIATTAIRVDNLSLNRSGDFAPRVALANNSDYNRDLLESSENFTLAWNPTEVDTFHVSYGRGVQVPSLVEFGGIQIGVAVAPGVTVNQIGNPNVNPTIVSNYEVAYDRIFPGAKFGIRLFYQQWSDLVNLANFSTLDIAPTQTTNGAASFRNYSNSDEKGVEVSASGKLIAGLGWRSDATYTDVNDSPFSGIDTVARSIAFQSTTPRYRGNIGLDWEGGPWEADANLHGVGAYEYYNLSNAALAPVKAYASQSARLGYRFQNGVVLAISGQNLLQDHQAQTTGLQAEREAQFTISKSW